MYAYVSSYVVLISFYFLYLSVEWKESNILLIKTVFFVGLIPSILFVALRGSVGTDTENYFQMVQDIGFDSGFEDKDIEIGFYLLLKGLVFLFFDPRLVVNLISFFIAVYCFYLFSNSKEQFLVFSLLVFPLFFFDMTMNGLRYGLSFLLAKHASDEYAANRKFRSLVLLVFCVGFQLSGVLVFFLLRVRRFRFLTLICTLLAAVIFYAIFRERLDYKFIAYTQLESPSVLSGLLPLAIFFACYFSLFLVDGKFSIKLFPLLALEISSFILAKFSYAGLRFQLLVLFVLFCFISEIDLKSYRQKKLLIVILFFLIGFVGFAGTLKHYIDDIGMPPSPFLPYHFFWEE